MEVLEKNIEQMINEIVVMIDKLPVRSKKIDFIKEQLSLTNQNSHGRRYSKELIAMACMWESVSNALYKQIQSDDVLTLPATKYCQRLSSFLTVDLNLSESTVAYLKLRIQKLLRKDLTMNLILDEVYSQQSMQYSSGSFYGHDGSLITKTLFCIMLKSIAGRFSDIVTMSPVANIS